MSLRHKVGDFVTIKVSLPFQHKHFNIDRQMEQYAGQDARVKGFRFELDNPLNLTGYMLDIDNCKFGWEDTMFESEGDENN